MKTSLFPTNQKTFARFLADKFQSKKPIPVYHPPLPLAQKQ